jgi:hypothetical protein
MGQTPKKPDFAGKTTPTVDLNQPSQAVKNDHF